MLKSTFILLTASLPFLAYSEDRINDEQCGCPLLSPEPVESCQLPVGVFYPALYTLQNCCVNFTLAGEFLYWQINRDFGEVGQRVKLEMNETEIDTLQHRGGYRPGFRVALGIGLPNYDDWAIDAVYTWMHQKTTNHFSTQADEFIFPLGLAIFQPEVPFSALKSQIKMNLDLLALTVGRSFYLSERLIIKPSAGFKSWWTLQNVNLFFTGFDGVPGTQFTKSGAWGIGPYVNVEIQALLWCGIYVLGKAGVWPNYTRFNKHHVVTNYPGFFNNEVNGSAKPYVTQLFYEGYAGLGWGSYLCDCRYHVDFAIAYDVMTNWVNALLLSGGRPIAEFYWQGLSVKAQFDF